MEILTLEKLKAIPPNTVFAKGILYDPRLWNKDEIKWVAVRGGIWDWAIYYHHSRYDYEYVKRSGDKCYTEAVIKRLVPCDEEAYRRYRF